MSSSNASIAYANTLNQISIIYVQCWSYLMFVLGICGHLLSIYVFTRPILWSNPCGRYFFASSISGLCVICYNLLTRLLQFAYRINIFAQSMETCKICSYLTFWIRAQTPWFIVLACVDRFLCSSKSTAVRKWSNIRVSSFMILFIILLIGIGYIHVPIYHQLDPVKKTCNPMAGFYQAFYGTWNLAVFALCPAVLMLSFGLLTIRNIRQSGRQVVPSNTYNTNDGSTTQNQTRRKNKTDRQLIRMMIFQFVVFTSTAMPNSVYFFYLLVYPTVTTDVVAVAVTGLATNVVAFLSVTGSCLSFYLFTLSSSLFRRELWHLFTCNRH